MKLIDTHTHLYLDDFKDDIDQVMKRALGVGVEKLYLPSINSGHIKNMFDLEKKYPEQIRLMMGLHPNYVKENYMDELEIVKKYLNDREFYAVGEIGIDLYWEKKYLKQQQEAFNYQILLAKEKDLPIVIHCRDAFDEIFEVLESHKDQKLYGIFHCFAGTKDQALRAIDLNFKLGIGGVVTFKNGKIDKFLKQIPIDQIVLETDSPYLSPTPYRGKRNESSYLEIILSKVAECYELPINEVSELIYQNSKEIFNDN